MTEDEKAQAVMEGLAGVRRCPYCEAMMEDMDVPVDARGRHIKGWACWICHVAYAYDGAALVTLWSLYHN